MPPRKCCCLPCEIGEDDFNRANSNPPSGSWHEISGEFEILDNALNTITPGVLATTVCHPPQYSLGSYIAEVTLIGMSDGTVSTWEVHVGDPAAPPYKVKVTHNSMTNQATLSLYNTIGLVHAETYNGVTTNQVLTICWAPGMMVSAFLGQFIPHIDDCTSESGSDCYVVGGVNVGGYSFAEGRFDDWTYEVHYIENQRCDPCSCFCWRSTSDYACLPPTLTLTFESVGADASTFPDIILTQSFNTPSVPWPNKLEGWNSEVFSCGSPVFEQFTFRFLCGNPFNFMALAPLSASYDISPGQFVWRWTEGPNPTNSFRNASVSASTCDPLSIVFPEIKITPISPSPICDPGLYPLGAWTPNCGSRKDECFTYIPDIRFIPRIII